VAEEDDEQRLAGVQHRRAGEGVRRDVPEVRVEERRQPQLMAGQRRERGVELGGRRVGPAFVTGRRARRVPDPHRQAAGLVRRRVEDAETAGVGQLEVPHADRVLAPRFGQAEHRHQVQRRHSHARQQEHGAGDERDSGLGRRCWRALASSADGQHDQEHDGDDPANRGLPAAVEDTEQRERHGARRAGPQHRSPAGRATPLPGDAERQQADDQEQVGDQQTARGDHWRVHGSAGPTTRVPATQSCNARCCGSKVMTSTDPTTTT